MIQSSSDEGLGMWLYGIGVINLLVLLLSYMILHHFLNWWVSFIIAYFMCLVVYYCLVTNQNNIKLNQLISLLSYSAQWMHRTFHGNQIVHIIMSIPMIIGLSLVTPLWKYI